MKKRTLSYWLFQFLTCLVLLITGCQNSGATYAQATKTNTITTKPQQATASTTQSSAQTSAQLSEL